MPQFWERQEGETDKAFDAFTIYRNLPERSLAKAAKVRAEMQGKSRVDVGQLERWSRDNDWVARAGAWDDHIDQLARRKLEVDLVKRRADVREREWKASEALIRRAEEINALPVTQQVLTDTETSTDGKTIINYYTIEPVRAAARDVARLYDEASKLSRLSTGLETDRIKIDMEVQAQLEELLSELRGSLSPAALGEIEAYLRARIGEGDPERITN